MNELSYSVRNRPSWWTELEDPAVQARWKQESLQQHLRGGTVSEPEVEQVMDQLKKLAADPRGIVPACGPLLYQSDTLVSEKLREEVVKAVATLAKATEAEKDWHKGLGGVVLDDVDPGLFSAVYGRTLRLSSGSVRLG
ncbi:hypothetical protein FRB90_004676 [Tulasnella sp. 427]|nr:hypothetical protein FRB90_004676 [Tulasnella sp. 427]